VEPVRGATGVQQPLVGGGLRHGLAAQRGRPLPPGPGVRVGCVGCHAHTVAKRACDIPPVSGGLGHAGQHLSDASRARDADPNVASDPRSTIRPPAARPEPTRPIKAQEALGPAVPAPAPAPVPAWLPPVRPARPDDEPEPEDADPQSPVFVDASGRRARLVRRLGILAGAALTAYLVVIGVNLAMDADVPLTPWPTGTGETRGPLGDDGKPVGDDPTSKSSKPRARDTGARSAPPAGTASDDGTTPASTPTPSKAHGKPVSPPAHGRDKPKPNG
jgi:hypothetical protein